MDATDGAGPGLLKSLWMWIRTRRNRVSVNASFILPRHSFTIVSGPLLLKNYALHRIQGLKIHNHNEYTILYYTAMMPCNMII